MLNAGDLDRRLKLQRAINIANSLNEDIPTWTTLATVWASKRDVSDGERVAAAEVAAHITTRFRVRYGSIAKTLTAADRVMCDGLVYEISAVKELGFREGIEITAAARPDLEPEES